MFAGVSNGISAHGKSLKFGGTCLIYDDKIAVAVSEERLSRQKYAGGHAKSLEYCLNSAGISHKELVEITTSSCCDFDAVAATSKTSDLSFTVCNHHYSHALSSYYCSSFDKAIVVVMDGGGNTLAPMHNGEWWKYPREQVSIYLAQGNKIQLLKRVFEQPYQIGYGEAFRYITKYLGFGSSEYAGKVMALAGLVDRHPFKLPNFFEIAQQFKNIPLEPIETFKRFLQHHELNISERHNNDDLTEQQIYLAKYLQTSFQSHLLDNIEVLIKETGITNFCFAGGVALNCVANTFILENSNIQNLFIQPAANDSGQCIGNAIFSYLNNNPNTDIRFNLDGCYLGHDHNIASNDIQQKIKSNSNLEILSVVNEQTRKQTINLLKNNHIIGCYQKRSEFGPRALGNRSILATPKSETIKDFVNTEIKSREKFMPLAASILEDAVSDFFDGYVSDYMLFAPLIKQNKREQLNGVIHTDGSCRAQKVTQKYNPYFYQLIKDYYLETGIPLLLNTSMNNSGEPIVETLDDALKWFENSCVNYLIINDTLIGKANYHNQ